MPCSGKEKKFLLAVVALDMLAVGLIVPLLTPFMRETLGASPSTMGMMGSLYGIVQLISGPFVGIVSDRFDRKQVLIICVVVICGICVNPFDRKNTRILSRSVNIFGL